MGLVLLIPFGSDSDHETATPLRPILASGTFNSDHLTFK